MVGSPYLESEEYFPKTDKAFDFYNICKKVAEI